VADAEIKRSELVATFEAGLSDFKQASPPRMASISRIVNVHGLRRWVCVILWRHLARFRASFLTASHRLLDHSHFDKADELRCRALTDSPFACDIRLSGFQ
jgi:hypothetical protein